MVMEELQSYTTQTANARINMMHVEIIECDSSQDLMKFVNEEIKRLYSFTPQQRNFTIIKDIQYVFSNDKYTAMLIYDSEI